MKISFFFKNFSQTEKGIFESYFSEKLEQINKFLGNYNAAETHLRIKAERFATKSAYNVSLELKLPKNILLVSEDDHTINEAIDLAKDKLLAQLKKIKNNFYGKEK
jgi:ribosomal subunit interface protein